MMTAIGGYNGNFAWSGQCKHTVEMVYIVQYLVENDMFSLHPNVDLFIKGDLFILTCRMQRLEQN